MEQIQDWRKNPIMYLDVIAKTEAESNHNAMGEIRPSRSLQ